MYIIQKYIALFYLPAYSPDLNPNEYLNNDFKRNVNTENFMSMLSNNPQRVAKYFKHEKIAYAVAS